MGGVAGNQIKLLKNQHIKKLSLLLSIKSLLESVFQILSKNELLNKCLHGQTQNNNESLNNVIWKRCPKIVFVSKKVLEVSVFSSIIEFNEEVIGLESVYVKLGIPYNFFKINNASKMDNQRMTFMNKKCTKKVIQRRKKLIAIRKGLVDKKKQNETIPVYQLGLINCFNTFFSLFFSFNRFSFIL